MKSLLQVMCSLLLLFFCEYAQAQFSQPPPKRPPPVCAVLTGVESDVPSPNASGGPRCASSDEFRTLLHCRSPWGSSTVVDCVTATEWFDGLRWIAVNPAALIHDWAFIIDGQESYLSSGESDAWGLIVWRTPGRYDGVYFDCGRSGEGYVRVTAAGRTDLVPFHCDPWGYE
jgi:hypothetical protein